MFSALKVFSFSRFLENDVFFDLDSFAEIIDAYSLINIIMNQGKYIFSQLMEGVNRYQFYTCTQRYEGEYRSRKLSCWEQFLALSFGQLSFRESLRDIVVCLGAQREKLYHLGFRSRVARATLADANERRDWRIYRDYAELLIKEAQRLYGNHPPADLHLSNTVYAIDSTVLEVCLSLFPWARMVKKRASIKLHVQLNLAGNIPSFFDFSRGKDHDIHFLDRISFEPGAYYVMDRGYMDFSRLWKIHEAGSFFVTRAKHNTQCKRRYSHPVTDEGKHGGIRCDQTIIMTGRDMKQHYPAALRRIKFYDEKTDQYYVFLTNNLSADAVTIALLYKYRWQIELFFKWVKQHLSIKVFWGRSENAVKTQICIALCTYLLVAILKKRLSINRNSYEILQILSVSLFDKIPFSKLISKHSTEVEIRDTENMAQQLAF